MFEFDRTLKRTEIAEILGWPPDSERFKRFMADFGIKMGPFIRVMSEKGLRDMIKSGRIDKWIQKDAKAHPTSAVRKGQSAKGKETGGKRGAP